jgi:SAM-dependent methyltransferase
MGVAVEREGLTSPDGSVAVRPHDTKTIPIAASVTPLDTLTGVILWGPPVHSHLLNGPLGREVPRRWPPYLTRVPQPEFPGVHHSPNIVDTPAVYEIENLAADRECLIESAMDRIKSWEELVLADIGAGAGFHAVRFAKTARHVIAVEPVDHLRLAIMRRVIEQGASNVSVVAGSAEFTGLADHSVDIVHARFAYFFGAGCEAGLREVKRLIRPGGAFFVVDNDWRHGQFAEWLRSAPVAQRFDTPDVIDKFWFANGFTAQQIDSSWSFDTRADLEAVVRIEFPAEVADRILETHRGNTVSYSYRLFWRLY